MTLRLGVLGGTFDPIHIGHLLIGEVLGDELSLDLVLIAPAGSPPHKPSNPISAPYHRLRMAELAVTENPRFRASAIDIAFPGHSYTADLLARIRAEHSDADIFFLMGADSLRELPTWNRPLEIVQLARIAVAQRPCTGTAVEPVFQRLPNLRGRVHLSVAPGIEISSSEIRTRASQRKSIRYVTPESVRQYIHDQGLYGTIYNRSVEERSNSSR